MGFLVNPGDRHPLRFRCQAVNGLHDLVVGVIEIIVHDHQVKVLVVGTLHFGTLLHGPLEVILLEATTIKCSYLFLYFETDLLKYKAKTINILRNMHYHVSSTAPHVVIVSAYLFM